MRVGSRGTRSAASPRRRSGKGVVAPSSTAAVVPIVALTATPANTATPAAETVSGPIAMAGPPGRRNGTNAATKRISGSTTRARPQITPGGTLAAAATAARATAHAAKTPQSPSGVVTATTVTPSRATSLARGSSRWTALSRRPATPAGAMAWLARTATRTPAAAQHGGEDQAG